MRRKILGVGAAIIPYLDELRPAATPEMAIRLESVAGELRFQDLRRDFVRLSLAKLPDLEDGAILISRFGFADVDGAVYRDWLDKVAAAVSADMPSDAGIGESVRRLSNHLFQSLGFAGNETRYYDADNSYLSRVIDTRRGIPVTLTVLMLLLARRLRLPLYGVGTPGHFLAGFKEGGSALFVDCFRGGQLMTLPEVKRMLVRNGYEWRPELGKPVSSRDILAHAPTSFRFIKKPPRTAPRGSRPWSRSCWPGMIRSRNEALLSCFCSRPRLLAPSARSILRAGVPRPSAPG